MTTLHRINTSNTTRWKIVNVKSLKLSIVLSLVLGVTSFATIPAAVASDWLHEVEWNINYGVKNKRQIQKETSKTNDIELCIKSCQEYVASTGLSSAYMCKVASFVSNSKTCNLLLGLDTPGGIRHWKKSGTHSWVNTLDHKNYRIRRLENRQGYIWDELRKRIEQLIKFPLGGTPGQVLTLDSDGTTVKWADDQTMLPVSKNNGDVLTWNNGAWTAQANDGIDDADHDPHNELQELELDGTELSITNNVNAASVDLSVLIGSGTQLTAEDVKNIVSDAGYIKSACNYNVGDNVDELGGYIFYLDASGCHGLVAAQNDIDNVGSEWCDKTWKAHANTTETGATQKAIGTGALNTYKIVQNTDCNNGGSAAAVADKYTVTNNDDVTFNDWFLPSLDELSLMYTNLHNKQDPIGDFADSFYWSSSEYGAVVWVQLFANDAQYIFFKNFTLQVRAVRAF